MNYSIPRLEGWSVINGRLIGCVYDHPDYVDGTLITTSLIAAKSGDGTVITASGAEYRLGTVYICEVER